MSNLKLPLIYLSGIITSAIAMLLVFMMMQHFNFNLLGLYIWIFPVGALIAGMLCGSGYMASSRVLNVNTGLPFAISVGVIAFAFYAFAHYFVYVNSGGDSSFSAFIGFTLDSARNSSLTIGKSHKSTVDSVGYVGYGLLALEYIGFIAGSVTVLNGAKDSSYCENCKQYFKTLKEKLYYMPALDKADLDGLSASEKSSRIEANTAQMRDELAKIREAVKGKTLEQTIEYLKSLAQKSAYRTTFYMTFNVQSCPKCGDHDILTQFYLHYDENQAITMTSEPVISNRKNSGAQTGN